MPRALCDNISNFLDNRTLLFAEFFFIGLWGIGGLPELIELNDLNIFCDWILVQCRMKRFWN